MKCCIVRDLLPNYIDGLTSEEVNAELEKHLEGCAGCRTVYEQMSAALPPEVPPEEKNIDFLRKLKARIRHRYAVTALFTCAVLAGLMIFAKNYRIPVPFDSDNMVTEMYQAAAVVNPYGNTQWQDLDFLDFETTRAVISNHEDIIRLVRLDIKEPARCNDLDSRGRTIDRGGETVRVVYYCYTETLWNRLFAGERRLTQITSTGDIYGNSLYHADYEPQMREIYYLPMGNMDRLEKLSDGDFDGLKGQAVLVWRGVV